MERTSLQGIANKAKQEKSYRFRNLIGELTVSHLYNCWESINKKASVGVDKVSAEMYEEDLIGNIQELVKQNKEKRYKARLVLRKYIPKGSNKLRPLGITATADKLLQLGAAKILEAIYEQDFYSCSYGYRPNTDAHKAIKSLSEALIKKRYHTIVEADIKGYFNNIDHDLLIEMLAKRIDDKAFLNLIRKWLKAGVLDNGIVTKPTSGTPQGGVISPILANIYLHHVLDDWFKETVQKHCHGDSYLCRYADDFVCAFKDRKDATRYYQVLKKRLHRFKLEVAEDKTNILRFSHRKPQSNVSFTFLGFEFHWGISRKNGNRQRYSILKRRTSPKKQRASQANFKEWLKKYSCLPKEILFARLNRKLRGYYQYYGIRGNYKSLKAFVYQITITLKKWLNRRSQRKSYNWVGFRELIKHFGIVKPIIIHAF